MSREHRELQRAAEVALRAAERRGVTGAAVRVGRERGRALGRRDGSLEELERYVRDTLTIKLFHRQRYGAFEASDLDPVALDAFVERALDVLAALAPDPLRSLPEVELYQGTVRRGLGLADPGPARDVGEVADGLADAEASARGALGRQEPCAIEGRAAEERASTVWCHSDGFRATRTSTTFSQAVAVVLREADGRRPVDRYATVARRVDALEPAARLGREAALRALARLGATPYRTTRAGVVIEARAAGRLIEPLLDALSGPGLVQGRSFLAGRVGQRVGSEWLTLQDDPWRVGGLGSRARDAEGLPSRPRVLIERGVLREPLLDTYHARRLGSAVTTGSPSNTCLPPGEHDLSGMLAALGDGLLVTGFLGGNVNATTGDFSLGVLGAAIEGGRPVHAVAATNLSGNLLRLFEGLVEVGDDPHAPSRLRTPSLRFEDVQISGC